MKVIQDECDNINDCQSGLVCYENECHLPIWELNWSDCNRDCGFGTQTSQYSCSTKDDGDCNDLIKASIKEAIRKMLPVQHILSKYLGSEIITEM